MGHNTDVEGVRARRDTRACGDSLRGAPGLVLGAGGAARAAALALARLGVRLTVVNRTRSGGRAPGGAGRRRRPRAARAPGFRWSALDARLVAAQVLVVNATSLGMAGAR